MIKVIGITRTLPRLSQASVPLYLYPYTDTQLLTILEYRARSYRYQHRGTTSGPKSNSQQQHSLLSLSDSDDNVHAFTSICSQALPLLSIRTRHVDEIWAYITAVWEKQFHQYPPPPNPCSGEGGEMGETAMQPQSSGATTQHDVSLVANVSALDSSSSFSSSAGAASIERVVTSLFQQPVPHVLEQSATRRASKRRLRNKESSAVSHESVSGDFPQGLATCESTRGGGDGFWRSFYV